MFIQDPAINSYFRPALLLLIGLVISLNTVTCKCNNSKQSNQYGELTMEVSPTNLVGDQKTTEATFKSTNSQNTADLTSYKLRVAFTETGGTGSSLTYLDGKKATHIITTLLEESVAHFASTPELDTQADPLRVPFTIVPGKGVSSMDVKFELIGQKDDVSQTYTANWENATTTPSVKLVLTSSNSELIGNDPLQLTIKNGGDKPSEMGKLTLKIMRSSGTSATIEGASVAGAGYELIWLEPIPVNDQGITKTLTIDPGTDKKATFIFQVIYSEGTEEKAMGEGVKVNWQIGAQLLLKDITYDKNTGDILYIIVNEGTEPLQEVKLHYHTKTNGVKVNGMLVNQPQTVDVGNLAPSEGKENINIGSLDFGGNQQAEFEFWLSYIGNTEQYAKQSKMFKMFIAADIHLEVLKLVYIPGSPNLIYNIQNKGKERAQQVALRYKNISSDKAGETVLLANKNADTINLPDIDGESDTGDQSLAIDFQLATKAKFGFEVLYRGKTILSRELEVETPTVNLKLVPVGPASLVGKETTAIWRIEQEKDSGPVDFNKLNVEISQTPGSPATMLYNGSTVTKLAGNELQLEKDIRFVIEPGGASKASFTLQLLYRGKPIGHVLNFAWEADLKKTNKELLDAISNGDLDEIKQLLTTIRANVLGSDNWTPLHEAVANGNIGVTKLLLDKKANVNAMDQLNGAPLHVAVSERENDELIKALLDKGADINIRRDQDGSTPLHIAATKSNQNYIKLLLDKKADVNVTNNKGDTPLNLIVSNSGPLKVIKALLDAGADVNQPNVLGETPLHYAATNDHVGQTIGLLLQSAANVQATTKRGETALHKAAMAENEAAIVALLNKGADINASDNLGNTPLHLAVQKAAQKRKKASVSIKDKDEDGNIVKLLLDKGAQKDIKNNKGETAVALATKFKNKTIKALFGITAP